MPASFELIENKHVPSLLNRCIDNGRFHLRQRLGSGGYSVVYLATDRLALRHKDVAIKCLLHDTFHRRTKSAREIALHKRAAALPGVAKIYHVVEDIGLLFIVLEFCPDGDLFSAICETKSFLGRDNLIRSCFLQLLDTVRGLHCLGIYHRDIKPENVLCTENGMRMLITDFGLATESERSETFGCGSYFYMTPECLAGSYSSAIKAYSSRAADIWALGILLVNLICSRSPWKTAMLSDPSFERYSRDCRWMQQMLPISTPAFHFLNRIFANHGNNISLSELRTQFLQIETFYMTASELSRAHKTARLVALEWLPETPVDDIVPGDFKNMTIIDDIDEEQLFEDYIEIDSEVQTPTAEYPASARRQLSSDSLELTYSESSGSESEFPITPETRPVQPAEDVPFMPADQNLGDKWQPTEQAHSFRKTLAAVVDGTLLGHLIH
ncbi:hypothetical protein EW145_g7597 [Phellinidium pouzarii]|uniref:Protein kinase domain-containing protein n=1 Tax=Phellinidium pouzarii TaxID=167371 RepID=A0A4S4KI29_9AGAM|nr:hypothetical protein EW145_g7597 [Phellinidium pouzarii]